MGSWGSAGDVGGSWLSTPIGGHCAAGQRLGSEGCAWRVARASYHNASCVDGLVDAAVEAYGRVCFDECAAPLDRVGDCYLRCYRNTLLGDASRNLTAMPKAAIVGPWEAGFGSGGAEGRCPEVVPRPCHGEQCGDH